MNSMTTLVTNWIVRDNMAFDGLAPSQWLGMLAEQMEEWLKKEAGG